MVIGCKRVAFIGWKMLSFQPIEPTLEPLGQNPTVFPTLRRERAYFDFIFAKANLIYANKGGTADIDSFSSL